MPSKNLAVSTVPLLMPYIQRRPETVGGKPFKLVSDYTPAGDQPEAIRQLIEGVAGGERNQVLLGVTGSGKTFTMANVIASQNRPTLVLAPNKTLAAQLWSEMKTFFPENAVEYFVSYYDYYQPEAYVPRTDTFIEKDFVDQRADRPHAPLGDAGADGARRRHHRGVGLLHLRHRPAGELPGDDLPPGQGRKGRPLDPAAAPRRATVQAQRQCLPARHLPGAWRHGRPVPRALRGQGLAHRNVRRRDRVDRGVRPADR